MSHECRMKWRPVLKSDFGPLRCGARLAAELNEIGSPGLSRRVRCAFTVFAAGLNHVSLAKDKKVFMGLLDPWKQESLARLDDRRWPEIIKQRMTVLITAHCRRAARLWLMPFMSPAGQAVAWEIEEKHQEDYENCVSAIDGKGIFSKPEG